MTADPLRAAIAAALAPHGPISTTAINDAATAAERVLGRDRCTHDRTIHTAHHPTTVTGCPWCTTTSPAHRTPTPPATTTIPTGDHL